ncbi:MAG: CBS domain-containing protein [Candidatus Aenigmarchaeota archaeon]|nr:CBS domain-containing protein [Candidatus Aenigmarchaeota archaeon]
MLPPLDEIKKRRATLGITQKELASLTGVSQSLVAKLESGAMVPSYKNAKSIFDAIERLEREGEPKAIEVANKKVIWISKEETVAKAVDLMKKKGVSQLPVFEGKHVIGSISEKGVLDAMISSKNPKAVHEMKVADVMEAPFPIVEETLPLSVVSNLLQHCPAVLLTNKEEIVGLVTKADLLKMI